MLTVLETLSKANPQGLSASSAPLAAKQVTVKSRSRAEQLCVGVQTTSAPGRGGLPRGLARDLSKVWEFYQKWAGTGSLPGDLLELLAIFTGKVWRGSQEILKLLRGKTESQDNIEAAALRFFGFKYNFCKALKGRKDVGEQRGKDRVF